MSLENLIKINQLQRHTATADEVQRLLAAAHRNLADSAVAGLSDETRFDAAYKAIMQCAMMGLMAMRKKRNLNDYSGDLIEPAAVRNCISHAQSLLTHTHQWLSEHRPELLRKHP